MSETPDQVRTRLEPDVKLELERRAKEAGRSVASELRLAVAHWLACGRPA